MLRWSSGLAAILIVLSFLAAQIPAAQFLGAEAAQKSKRPAAAEDANTAGTSDNPATKAQAQKTQADKTQAAATKDAPPVSDRAVTGISAGKDKSDGKSEPAAWKPEEIAAAKARCDAILKTIDAVAVPEPPIKEGKCGTPAPIRVSRLGKANPVSFDPPALMQCDLAEALSRWLDKDVQPLAIKHLGAPVAKLEIMSDYSCRTSAGRVQNRLSEHAFADALDIGGFITAKGKAVRVLALWGKTNRDMIAEAEAEAAKALAEAQSKAAASKSAEAKSTEVKPPEMKAAEAKSAEGKPADAGDWAKAQTVKSAPAETGTSGKTAAARKKASPTLKLAAAKLGGPSAAKGTKRLDPKITAALAPPAPATPTARFLHESHAAACRIFGTTLGPEANEDHRNHFHVDMAERKYKKICD